MSPRAVFSVGLGVRGMAAANFRLPKNLLSQLLPSGMLAAMIETDHALSFSNPGPGTLRVWLEPWAEEFEVPARSTMTLSPTRNDAICPLGELEWAENHLIIWASAQKVSVSIDGVDRHSGSATIPIPEGLSKALLEALFAEHPEARLGGTDHIVPERLSWWVRLKRRLGISQ